MCNVNKCLLFKLDDYVLMNMHNNIILSSKRTKNQYPTEQKVIVLFVIYIRT